MDSVSAGLSERVVVLGAQRYRVQRPWPGVALDMKSISSVAVLADGRVAALLRSAPVLRIFSADGMLLAQWDVPGLVCGHHIRARQGGGLLLTDLDGHRVFGLDSQGQVQWVLGDAARPQWMAPFNHPTDAAEDSEGRLYVADGYGNSCVHRFDAQHEFLGTYGNAGDAAGQFSTPHAVVVGPGDEVFVADRENNRVQVFDTSGGLLRQIGNMYKPMSLAITPDGNLLVSDQTPRLSIFTLSGQLLGRCRIFGVYGHGIAVAADGAIYIAEMVPDMLTRLQPIV